MMQNLARLIVVALGLSSCQMNPSADTAESLAPPPAIPSSTRPNGRTGDGDTGSGGDKGAGSGSQTGTGTTTKKAHPPRPRITERLGIYLFETDLSGAYPVIRYKKNKIVMTRQKFIEELAKPAVTNFRSIVNKSIAQLPSPLPANGYMIQAPAIRNTNLNDAFYFVAIKHALPNATHTVFDQYMSHCNPAPIGANRGGEYALRFINLFAFNAAFVLDVRNLNDVRAGLPYGAVIFRGKSAVVHVDPEEVMVVPCPVLADLTNVNNAPLGHIYSFAKAFSDETVVTNHQRVQAFWYTVGFAARTMLNGGAIQDIDGTAKAELYLSTHGIGVSYLHFRLENHQRYYHQVAELINDIAARNYYLAVFR